MARHLSWHIGQLGIDPSQGPALTDIVLAFRERTQTLREMAEQSVFLYREFAAYEEKAARKHLDAAALVPLRSLHESLSGLVDWQAAAIHQAVNQVAETLGLALGKVAQPLRVAVSGAAKSPPIDITLELLGRARALERLQRALDFIHQNAAQQ